MSKELQVGLESVERNEYFSALAHLSVRQNDASEAHAMVQSFGDSFPELLKGVDMINIIGQETGQSDEIVIAMRHGALLALLGLKEVIDIRNLNGMTSE